VNESIKIQPLFVCSVCQKAIETNNQNESILKEEKFELVKVTIIPVY
jgi:hypothetical protein